MTQDATSVKKPTILYDKDTDKPVAIKHGEKIYTNPNEIKTIFDVFQFPGAPQAFKELIGETKKTDVVPSPKTNGTVQRIAPEITQTNKQKGANPGGKLNVGSSVVDLLKSFGEDSDFESRKGLASELLGIEPDEYRGTKEQNMLLMKAVKKRGKKSDAAPDKREKSIREQNRDYIQPSDDEDGTWDAYLTQVLSDGGADLPNFGQFKKAMKDGADYIS